MRAPDQSEVLPLTGLRFVAALLVFIFHIHMRWPVTENAYLDRFLSGGAIGMSVFFVLSGYILAHTYSQRSFTPWAFYRARFARIYPIYAIAAIVTIPWLVPQIREAANPALGAAQLGALAISDALMVQAWFPQMFDFWNNSASWSLSAEAFFYALFPFLVLLFADRRRVTLMVFAVLLYCASILPGFVYAAFEPRPNMGLQIFYAMPVFRLPEFAIGICTFYLVKDERSNRWLPILTGAALIVLTLYLALLGDRVFVYVLHNWVVVPTVALSIATLATCRTWAGTVLSHSWFVWGGKISYCFYSFQALVIFSLLSAGDALPRNGSVVLLVAFVALTVISAAGYHWIEEPMRLRIRRATNPAPVLANG